MAEYAGLEYLYQAKKRKALFFKRYYTRFEVIYYDEKSKGAESYRELAAEVIKRNRKKRKA